MELQTAKRKKAKIKLAITGASGSGKTYSSLLLAHGLAMDWEKVVVIDTENHSSHLYAHLGAYKVLNLDAPYTPESYIDTIDFVVSQGMEVVIIDSLSHEWECLLDYHSNLTGNSFANWAKVTPRHQALVQKMLQAPVHIIATMRSKSDYVLSDKNGKMVPEKVGLKAIQRDGLDYEFTLVFDIDIKHLATATKDRTGLFSSKPEFKITSYTGQQISQWCMEDLTPRIEYVKDRIQQTNSTIELLGLYNQYPEFRDLLLPYFEKRKQEIRSHFITKKVNPIENV
ncbi:AAA family ATPase [Aquirufa sp. ROCK2-A2]